MVHRTIIVRTIILNAPSRSRRIGNLSFLFVSCLGLAATDTAGDMIVPQIWVVDGDAWTRLGKLVLPLLLLLRRRRSLQRGRIAAVLSSRLIRGGLVGDDRRRFHQVLIVVRCSSTPRVDTETTCRG